MCLRMGELQVLFPAFPTMRTIVFFGLSLGPLISGTTNSTAQKEICLPIEGIFIPDSVRVAQILE